MAVEFAGVDEKEWLAEARHAQAASRADWWLFKSVKHGVVKAPGGAVAGGYRRTDDRVEKIACELARLIDLPSAEIELAVRGSAEGLLSRNVMTEGAELQPADVMLSEYPGYVSCAQDRKMKERPGHNLANIRELLSPMFGPPDSLAADWPAFDVFAGYLVFDAWIANADRHAMNWAVLRTADTDHLAKTFDHGSALGSGLTDVARCRELERGLAAWCRRGVAHRFENGRATTLVEHALSAVRDAGARASEWVERLGSLDRASWQAVIDCAPGMSDGERRFIDAVLVENRRRLCDDSRDA